MYLTPLRRSVSFTMPVSCKCWTQTFSAFATARWEEFLFSFFFFFFFTNSWLSDAGKGLKNGRVLTPHWFLVCPLNTPLPNSVSRTTEGTHCVQTEYQINYIYSSGITHHHWNVNICDYIGNTCNILPWLYTVRCSFQDSMVISCSRQSHFENDGYLQSLTIILTRCA